MIFRCYRQTPLVEKLATKPSWVLGGDRRLATTKASKLFNRLESPVALNHREKDLAGRVLLLRSEGHDRSTDVESADVVDNPEHVGACRVRSGLLQRGDNKASGKITLQRYEFRLHIRIERLFGGLVVGDDLHRNVPGEGDDLGDNYALAFGAELLRQRVGADKGDIDEDRIKAALVRELDKLGARPVCTDHDHRFRFGAPEGAQRRANRPGIALERAFGRQLHAALFQRKLDAGQTVAAIGIVLVEDRNVPDMKILGQVLDPRLGLGGVAGANIDHIVEVRRAEESSPGERTDERHIGSFRNWNGRGRGGRADGADQRENLVFLDQPGGLHDRAIGIVTIVPAEQLEPAAVHTTLGVDLGEGRENALPHTLAERRRGTLECCRLTEQDAIGTDAGLVAPSMKRIRHGEQDRKAGEDRQLQLLHGNISADEEVIHQRRTISPRYEDLANSRRLSDAAWNRACLTRLHGGCILFIA